MTAAITPRLVSEEEALVPEPSPLNPETLQGLAARVAAANGPDRDLDCDLFEAFGRRANGGSFTSDMRGADGRYYHPDPEWPGAYPVGLAPRFTAAFDAALSLVDLAMPTALPGLSREDGSWTAWVVSDLGELAQAPTPALALLSALLAALANRPEKPE